MLSLSTINVFACNSSFALSNSWSLNPPSVDLSTNPTSLSSHLVIPANAIPYGLYEFSLLVNITLSNGSILSNTASTFFRIIPTGLAVFALQNGISRILIGSQQTLTLDPAAYSIDLDALVSPNSLQYTFYCHTVNLTSTLSTKQNNSDLLTYKTNPLLAMSSINTCFNSNSNTFFNF